MSVAHADPRLKETTAQLQEIFSSIQGEGPFVGYRQIFVRFNACHLKCAYCDTPPLPNSDPCLVETASGSGHKEALPNPVSVETALYWVDQLLSQGPHHSLSLTGGEPILYTSFLSVFLPEAKKRLPIYLETSGTMPERLEPILPYISLVAMDIKLASTTGEPQRLEEHQQFYELVRKKEMYIKLVFGENSTMDEMDSVKAIVTDRFTPIVLQPMTSLVTGKPEVSQAKIFACYDRLRQHFDDVRVIPQTHKMIALL